VNPFRDSLAWLATLVVINTAAVPARAQTANLPVPPAGFDQVKNGVPKGTVTLVNYQTQSNGSMPARVYTPPGYAEDKQYPTLYLLHGIGGDENEWYNQGAPHVILDNLLAESKVKPMVLVLPRAKVGDDFPAFEDVLLNDLIPYIEDNYSVVKASSGRALAGLSMGGGQTLAFGFGNVDVFTHLGIFSPAPNSPNPPANAFTDLEATKREVKVIYLSCGTVEQPYRGTCEAYDEYMNDNDIEHTFQLEEGLDHNFTNWKRGLFNFSQRIFDDVGPSPGGAGGMAGMAGGGAGGQGGASGAGGSSSNGGTGGSPAAGGVAGSAVVGSGGASGAGIIGAAGAQAGSSANPATGNGTAPSGDDGGAGCACKLAPQRSSWVLSFAFAAAGAALFRARRRAR
jgi:enterochelin esterase-like enzyme